MNWSFLKEVLLKHGFQIKFVGWVMAFVSSISFEVLINGGKSAQFKLSRGLRQGDPPFSYLFILGKKCCQACLNMSSKTKRLIELRLASMAQQ